MENEPSIGHSDAGKKYSGMPLWEAHSAICVGLDIMIVG